MKRQLLRALLRATALLALPSALGCSVGQGTGDVHSKGLFARDCWGTDPDGGTQAVGAAGTGGAPPAPLTVCASGSCCTAAGTRGWSGFAGSTR